MLSNNKFLGKCWYGGKPWIRLAMESESMMEKIINFIFCLGTAYDISTMESVGSSKSFSKLPVTEISVGYGYLLLVISYLAIKLSVTKNFSASRK